MQAFDHLESRCFSAAWIERAAANDNMFIHQANQEIYELDSILARPDAGWKPNVDKGEEMPF
jgi:hypothetical protein